MAVLDNTYSEENTNAESGQQERIGDTRNTVRFIERTEQNSPEATSPNEPYQETTSDTQGTASGGENSTLTEEGLRHVVDMIKKMTWIKYEDPNGQETLDSLTIHKD